MGGGNFAPVPTPSSPANLTSPIPVKSYLHKEEMTFDRRLANITTPVFRGSY